MPLLSLVAEAAAPTPSVTDWLGVVLSSIAITIGVVVAYYVWRQSKDFHRENRDQSFDLHRENRDHAEATHSRERYESLVGLSTEVLDSARLIQKMTSERWAHLVGLTNVPDSPADDEGRLEAGRLVTVLENRAEQLMAVESLMPHLPETAEGQTVRDAVKALRVEAAWLVGDADNAVISFFGGPDYNEPLHGTPKEIAKHLVADSICNVNRRLLLGSTGHQAYIGQVGNPWEDAMAARVDSVLTDEDPDSLDTVKHSTAAVEANLMLHTATDRFATALFALIDAYEVVRKSRMQRSQP